MGLSVLSEIGSVVGKAIQNTTKPAGESAATTSQSPLSAPQDGFDRPVAKLVDLSPTQATDQAYYEQAAGQLNDLRLQLADSMMKSGQYDAARALLSAPSSIPNVKRDPFDKFKSQSVWDGPPGSGRSTTFKNHVDFEETDASLTQRKLAQVDQLEKMSKLVGHPIDPNDVGQVKEYFDKLSAQKPPVPTSQIQDEYGQYVKNFYVHPGGVDWGNTPLNDRVTPQGLTQLLKDQPKDSTGRTTLDCEGHTYLTKAIFGNNPRFDVVMASNSSHIAASVFEKGSDKGFSVNTLSSPVVTPIVSQNTPGLLKLYKGDWSKVHEKLAAAYLDGQGQGQALHTSRDINVVNGQKYD